jgi:hypothetical protein
MAFDSKGLDSYNDVPSRIAEFREKHPDGSLQPADLTEPFKVLEIAGQTFIAYTAAAYRTPDDPRPGIGAAYECFPGRTPYTKGSELQNAETSAWGRAIVAALAADTRKGVASMEEVRNRQAERDEPAAPVEQHTDHAWLTDIESRISVARNRAELTVLAREISARKQAGQCEPAHEAHLWATGKKRQEAIDARPTNKDGSTSRSRATDDQLAASGDMTKAQLKEHNKLERDTLKDPKPAERATAADPDDPWANGGEGA